MSILSGGRLLLAAAAAFGLLMTAAGSARSRMPGEEQTLPVVALPVTAQVELSDEDSSTDSPVRVEIRREQQQQALQALQARGEGPQVMIYHTHSQEAYERGEQPYREVAQWRTADQDYNIVRVGEELARLLQQEHGIEVLHDTTDHEPPRLGTAYVRSLETLEQAAAREGSLKIFIDLHRDAYSQGMTRTVELEGEEVAPLMVVIGTGEGTAGNGFSVKPDWESNYALAERITRGLQAIHPQLARPIRVKTGRYNQHISTGCVLIEAGHNENTLQQALAAMPYLAQVLADVMG